MGRIYNVYKGCEFIGEMDMQQLEEYTGVSEKKIKNAIASSYAIINDITAVYDGQINLMGDGNVNRELLKEFAIVTSRIRGIIDEQQAKSKKKK